MADSSEEINQILNNKTQPPAGNRDASVQKQSRPSSANRELQKEREERIKQMKERQNEERQKKLEELKAQALAAQKFRELKEEERRRRMDDLRRRDCDRRSQVEERRRAIIEADNERREYILRKNQERDQRMETKRRNDRGSIQFAFGSSTPRMIDTSDSGMCSSFWSNRRATSITNVAYVGAALTRRSSERELTDSASKKRATSASGLDRSTDDQRRMSSSMYEVFNWTSTSECPRKLTFSLAGSGINIDEPPTAAEYQPAASRNYASGKDDTAEMNYQRTVNRRKTDLMPTIPSPRDSSRSSLGTHTPRTPGRAFSMTRLDTLAQPRRRNGEHISAILERERRQALELENLTRLSLSSSRSSPTGSGGNSKRMSRSMTQLAGSGAKYRNQSQDSSTGRSPGFGGGRKSSFNTSSINSGSTSPMRRNDTSKSMSQLNTVLSGSSGTSRITKTERLRQQYHHQQQQQHHNQLLVSNGLRSGEMTPTSLNTSRPGSAMSSSTTASGIVYRRSLPAQRKPRPASIAVTGVTATGLKEEKPPLPKTGSGASTGSSVNSASIKHRLSSAGSGSINTTPAKSSSSTETPTKKPLTLHSAEKRATGVRVATPKASSTPLQSPGPEKASRNLQDALKKASEVTKKPPVSEKTQPKQSILKSDIVTVENQEEPSVLKAEEPTVESEKVQDQAEGSLLVSLVEVEPSFGQDEQPQQQQEEVVVPVQQEAPLLVDIPMEYTEVPKQVAFAAVEEEQPEEVKEPELDQQDVTVSVPSEVTVTAEDEMLEVSNGNLSVDGAAVMGDAMTASMIAKRINTEEEAKAALAERRRLAREEAERQAELERKRIEAEEQAERQRVLEEEERLRKLEEETIRLAEEQRRMEDERLQQAIEEARRRDEEERKRREEEARQKAEREEAERKAREEAERLRVEMAERLKKEEKEREERRKRVEAIMSRTRTKGTANNTPTKNNEDDRENAMSKSQIVLSSKPAVLPTGTAMSASTISMTDSFIASELRQEQQQHQSLDQAMESLSLSNNNNSSSNGSNSNSSSSSETLANSTNINNNINNNSTNGSSMQQFEKSVTEKENLLLVDSTTGSSMVSNNNLNNGSASNGTVVELTPNEQGTNGESIIPTTNGKTEQPSVMMATSNGSTVNTTANSTSDLIIEDALMGQTNGHKNGSMDNVLNGNDSEHPKSHKESTEAAVLLESNDLLVSNTGDHLLHGGDPETILSFADTANTAGDHQQHSSFDSSATISTVTTESTIVTGDSAGSNAYQLIDFASFSTSDEPENIQLREGIISDANFNPLTPFGMPEAESAETTQHLALDLHNLSNNNSINPFFTSDEHATLPVSRSDGSNRDPSGNIVPEAALFDLGFDSTSTTSTSSTFFNNNNTTSPNNTPWMVSATSDGQDKRDLSLL